MGVDEVQTLVARVQDGDEGAFGDLYAELAPRIYRFLLCRVDGGREVAEDLTAEVFLKVLERLDRYQSSGSSFVTWLYCVARNHLIDHFRAQSRQRIGSLDLEPEIPAKETEQRMSRVFDRDELAGALGQLTSDQDRVVTLRFLDGFTIAETAAMMGKTEHAVKKLQTRGLLRLRQVLKASRRTGERLRPWLVTSPVDASMKALKKWRSAPAPGDLAVGGGVALMPVSWSDAPATVPTTISSATPT